MKFHIRLDTDTHQVYTTSIGTCWHKRDCKDRPIILSENPLNNAKYLSWLHCNQISEKCRQEMVSKIKEKMTLKNVARSESRERSLFWIALSMAHYTICVKVEKVCQFKEDWTLEWTLFCDFSKLETRRNIKKW